MWHQQRRGRLVLGSGMRSRTAFVVIVVQAEKASVSFWIVSRCRAWWRRLGAGGTPLDCRCELEESAWIEDSTNAV